MKYLFLTLCGVLIFMGTLGTTTVYAYLDPGSGSMLLQLLLGGVAGIVMIAKLYWARIKEFFRGGSSTTTKSGDNESDQ